MSSKGPPGNGKVSRVRPIQRAATIAKPALASSSRNIVSAGGSSTMSSISNSVSSNAHSDGGSARQRQLIAEQASQISELEAQLADLRKKNVHLNREMQEALGLQQLKNRTVDALTKDLTGKSDLERRLNDFLSSIEADCLDGVADEVRSLRKKCLRSEEYLAELNEKYRDAVLRNQQLEESFSDLKAEFAVKLASTKGGGQSDLATTEHEDLKSLAKRNAALEQKCESLTELKDKIVKLEIEKRDLKAENTQLKGKVSSLQRDKKLLSERITVAENESGQKIKELKEAQARHLEMLSKLRRSHTKMDAKYKHLLKERAQWQSLFRTANGELSKSTESLASISSAASTSVSRQSFFRDSSNLEEYNIHLESELVAVQENLKLSEKERDRLDKRLKALAEQVLQDENLITELDQNRAALMDERDSLRDKCLSYEEEIIALQRSVEELREQLDTALFENNELSLKEDEARSSLTQEASGLLLDTAQTMKLFQEQMLNVDAITDFVENVMTEQEHILVKRLDEMDKTITSLAGKHEKAKSQIAAKNAKVRQQQEVIDELRRQVDVLKNNAESLAKDLGVEVRDRSATEMAKMQDEISAKDAKLKDYEKMQKVLKKALVENESLKENMELFKAKVEAAESRVVELEGQLRCEQQLVTESNGKLNERLRQAERENERLQGEFSIFEEQIAELGRAKDALTATESDRDTLRRRIASLEESLEEATSETDRLQSELTAIRAERKDQADTLREISTKAEGLKMTLAEKAQQIASLISDLEAERAEKSAFERTIIELREQGEKHLNDKDQKMAQLADELRAANHDLQDVLREKAQRIDALERQILESSAAKQRQLDELTSEQQMHTKQSDNAKATCVSFVDALEMKVDHSLTLYEFIPKMTDAALKMISSKNKQLEDVGIELERAQKEAEQGMSFANSMEQLKDQLSRDEENLKRYEEALASQAASIERMTAERADLEKKMAELRENDNREIQKLRTYAEQLETQLKETSDTCQQVPLLEQRCTELESQHKASVADKNETISELESRLGDKIIELDELSQKMKAFSVMEERLNAVTIEVGQCQTKIEELLKDVEDKEQKLVGKNQVIHELETELSERIATFDEMAKVFALKGEEYKKVREMLVASEEKIEQLKGQLSLTDSTLNELSGKLLPNVSRDSAEMWMCLSERVDELFKELQESHEKTNTFEKQLECTSAERNSLIDQLSDLQRALETRQAELDRVVQSEEELRLQTDNLNSELKLAQGDHAGALEEVEKLKADNETIARRLDAKTIELDNSVTDITNLRKLLAESESVVRGLSEQHNERVTNLMEKIQSINRERDALQERLDRQIEENATKAQTWSAEQAGLKEEIARMNNERESMLKEKQSWEEMRAELERNATKAETQYADKCQELEELTKVLAGKQTDMARFEEKLHALKDKYSDRVQTLQKSVSTLQNEKAELTKQIDLSQQQLKAVAVTREELETSLQNKCESLEVLRSEMDLLEGRLQETCSQYEDCQRKLEEREAEVARLVDDVGNVKMALSERSEDVNSYHDHIKALAEEKIRLETETASLRRKIDDNSEEYQKEALEMQQELSIMTERYNIKCHECESLSRDVATKAADVDVLTAKLLSMESDLSKSISRVEQLEKTSALEKQTFSRQLSEETNQKDLAFTATKQLEEKISLVKAESSGLVKELNDAKSQLQTTLKKKDEVESKLKAAEWKAYELSEKLGETKREVELKSKEISALRDQLMSYQAQMQMELESVRGLLIESKKETQAMRVKYEDQLDSLREELVNRTASEECVQQTLHKEVESMKDSMASQERLLSQKFEESVSSLESVRDELCSEKKMSDCLRSEKAALEEELMKVQASLKEAHDKLANTENLIQDLQAAKSGLERQLEASLSAIATAKDGEGALRHELAESRRSSVFLDENLAKMRDESAVMQRSIEALASEKATLEHRYAQLSERDAKHKQTVRELQDRLDSLQRADLAKTEQLEGANRTIGVLAEYRQLLEQVQETLEVESPDRIVPVLRQHKSTIAQLGSGVMMVRRELGGHQHELGVLRQLIACQREELSTLISGTGQHLNEVAESLVTKNSTKQQQQIDFQRTSRTLVDRCLEVLRQHDMRSLAKAMAVSSPTNVRNDSTGTAISDEAGAGEHRSPPHDAFALPPDDFDMHFQTFNGPTAQFVAEQQASSAARLKLMRLAAAMDHDDTAPKHYLNANDTSNSAPEGGQPNGLANGDNSSRTNPSSLIRIDPFETIKQQKILIHELMAKLESTKKVLDGEMTRRKELDERFRQWSSDKRLHNAQVSFNVAQMNNGGSTSQREDSFDCAPLLNSQAALIPETSLHVSRQFPSYVDNFIRWLITTAPARFEIHSDAIQRVPEQSSTNNESEDVALGDRLLAREVSTSRLATSNDCSTSQFDESLLSCESFSNSS